MQLPGTHFKSKLEKLKKNPLKKVLSGSNIKKFLISSQRNAFLIFRETKTQKKIFIFQETELFFIFQKASYISGSNFLSSKDIKNTLKRLLTIRDTELSILNIRNFKVPRKKTLLFFWSFEKQIYTFFIIVFFIRITTINFYVFNKIIFF